MKVGVRRVSKHYTRTLKQDLGRECRSGDTWLLWCYASSTKYRCFPLHSTYVAWLDSTYCLRHWVINGRWVHVSLAWWHLGAKYTLIPLLYNAWQQSYICNSSWDVLLSLLLFFKDMLPYSLELDGTHQTVLNGIMPGGERTAAKKNNWDFALFFCGLPLDVRSCKEW